MRILIPSTGDKMESLLDQRFKHATYYIIYDGKEFEIIANNIHHSHHHKRDIDFGKLDILIVNRIGIDSFKTAKENNVKIYYSPVKSVGNVLTAFKSGNLKELTEKDVIESAHKSLETSKEKTSFAGKIKNRLKHFGKSRIGFGRGPGLGKRHH